MLRLLHHSACPLRESLASIEHAAMTVTRSAEMSIVKRQSRVERTA
jgi:hypothetical protein